VYDALSCKKFISKVVLMANTSEDYQEIIEEPALELLESLVIFTTELSTLSLSQEFVESMFLFLT
jgi:hypothetical protein